ncbi:type IV secretion system protein [Glutamicibacter uratoxydans]|uniref:type IV secretion system protein n=1 Tax=Glutamicibacter uratoxydans TaxID=43667 RepID=UPI003D6E0D77
MNSHDFHDLFWGSIQAFAQWAWFMLESSFRNTEMDSRWWISVIGGDMTVTTGADTVVQHIPGMLNIIVVAAIPLLIVFAAIQIVISVFRGSTVGMVRAFVSLIMGIPAVYIVAGLLYTVSIGMDQVSLSILSIGGGDTTGTEAVMQLFGITFDTASNRVLMDENYQQWAMSRDRGNIGGVLFGVLIALIVFLAAFFLTAMMVLRLVAILLLAVFLPIAVYGMTLDAAKGMFNRWLGIVVGLLLAKPAAAVTIKMGMTISTTAPDAWQFAAGIVCLFAAAFMPLLLTQFVSFITSGQDSLDRAALAGASGGYRQGVALVRGGRTGFTRTVRSTGRFMRSTVGRGGARR